MKSRRAAKRRSAVSFASSGLAVLLIGDHEIDEAKAGASSVIGLEGGDRFSICPDRR